MNRRGAASLELPCDRSFTKPAPAPEWWIRWRPRAVCLLWHGARSRRDDRVAGIRQRQGSPAETRL